MTNQNEAAVATAEENEDRTTDITVILEGQEVDYLKDATPETAAPHISAALLAAAMGMSIELQLSDPGVYGVLSAVLGDSGVKFTLKAAA